MGSRANFVVVSDAGVELYYDHWGAQGLTYDLVLDGERESLARIRSMRPQDATAPMNWLDDVWAEGGAVMDLRTNQLRWFDCALEGMRPRLAGYLLERTWPGWKSVWIPEGLKGFFPIDGLAQVGCEDRTSGRRVWSRPVEDLQHLAVAETADGRVTTDSVLSVRGEGGDVRSVALGAMLDVVSELRAEWVVDFVSRACRRAGLRDEGRGPVHDFSSSAAPGGQGGAWIHQGMLVDLATRRVTWWSQGVEDGLAARFAVNWPGFTVETRGDDYAWHEREARIVGVQPPLGVMLHEERESLRRAAERGAEMDPLAPVVARLRGAGRRVVVSPWAAERVSSARTACREAALEALDDLIATGLEALPPARYVDSHGVVVEPAG
ncbi:hypothetical protein [Oerskovia turbata]